MTQRRRYAQVGLGGRHTMFRDALVGRHADTCELVGLCDSNEGRLRLSAGEVDDVPGYLAADFDKMVAETRPDVVIVTTKDCHHDEYICRAMELGCDVVTEKPMTTDEEKCRRILEMQKATGRSVRVTFNYRYSPPRTQIKDMLMSGVIGEVISVDFHWLLDVSHGADYFRRWHRNKVNSGGLMVHKATHHFDLVNWWLGTVPETVYASGQRRFYLPETADRYGLTNRGERCHGCPEFDRCKFYLDLTKYAKTQALYLDCESYDGYFRDRCVFSGEIDIEDSMNLVVDYQSGAKMSYSLNAFMPWEGYLINFNGTKGRLEHVTQESVYVSGDDSVPGQTQENRTSTRVCPHWQPPREVEIWTAGGGHGGGDEPLVDDVLSETPAADKYLRAADHRAGAWSILTGVAANRSIAENRPVRIDELAADIGMPDYPPMPGGDDPLGFGTA